MAAVIDDANFCVVFGWMCTRLHLSGNELLVYAMIYGFSQDGESRYFGGRGYLARSLNISKPTVDKALKTLCDKGYIRKVDKAMTGVAFCEYYADLQVVKELSYTDNFTTSKDSLPSSKDTLYTSKDTLPDSKDSLPNNIDIINREEIDSKEITKQDSKKPLPLTDVLKSAKVVSDNPELMSAYQEFIKMREKIKRPLTDYALKRIINKTFMLARGDPHIMAEIVNQSVEHSWQGVFALKKETAFIKASDNEFLAMLEEEEKYDEERTVTNPGNGTSCIPSLKDRC